MSHSKKFTLCLDANAPKTNRFSVKNQWKLEIIINYFFLDYPVGAKEANAF